ncbi:hypothetical protein CI109_101470 [Kwoniella shandongensis]|uniref:Mediator of RNA polymerase II transcription subunit 10 n=1 Tax=Kwoniella shandongensis TaxID=1734106 RepID=A0A5M6C3Z2_9TREE|nr:uncharacterized protein CI109_001936 [Kwoniella shandongensis]KAA5529511.1 hypothetical protein CI109_001936 [Kwoniella shandongensis]
MSLAPPHLPSPAPTPSSLPSDHPHLHTQNPSHPSSNPESDPNHTNGDGGQEQDQAALRAEAESQLLRLSQDLYELEICAGEVGPGMEDAVPNYLMKINKAFVELSSLSTQMTDSVPHQIIDNVDRFKNPHYYTKQTITRATGENQFALGRVLGLESFRRQLHSALEEDFPQIPLPDRRHQPPPRPVDPSQEGQDGPSVKEEAGGNTAPSPERVIDGQATSTGALTNGQVKMEVEEQAPSGRPDTLG